MKNAPVLEQRTGAFLHFQREGKKTVMCGNEGCDKCATCCHILSVAAAFKSADWYVLTQ
ncbi:hypothetical protein D3C86_2150350 [compost metagenome]